jgi:hypothetical protein
MNRCRFTNRVSACCLVLSAVLVLGIIQWSFLPILIQNGPVSSHTVIEVSAGHSSKFAAPFKGLIGEVSKPRLAQSRVFAAATNRTFFRRPEERVFTRDEVFFSDRQLRAPPSA